MTTLENPYHFSVSAFVSLEFRHSYFRFGAVIGITMSSRFLIPHFLYSQHSQHGIENTNVEIRVKQMHS